MSTAFVAIAEALAAALLVPPALADGLVRANPTTALERDKATGIAVRLQSAQQVGAGPCAAEWRSTYGVECIARSNTGADPAAAVDALLAAVWVRIAALDLAALSVSDVLLDPQIDWEYDTAETPMAAATLRLTVAHFTERTTLNAAPPNA
mgnify:CR=1 FL=1